MSQTLLTTHHSHPGYPRHRENRENGQKRFPVRENTGNLEILSKHREFCQNTGKTQGICFAQVDSKSKGHCDIYRNFFSRSWKGLPSQFCVCNSHKLFKLAQGKSAVRQGINRENTGNLKMQFEWVPCSPPPTHCHLGDITHDGGGGGGD